MPNAKADNQAPILWAENDTPLSSVYDDTYYSKEGVREETAHVFLAGNGLPARWQAVPDFIIGELGFGTGLNFLETYHRFMATAPKDHHLTFISFEAFPMDAASMIRALSPWPDLARLARPLLTVWPPSPGWHAIPFEKATLHLAIGNANTMIAEMPRKADTWYLDGFSPAKNPELWGEALMAAVFKKTKDGGTFATYTAAGWVRRNLEAAGFTVERRKGFGRKRDMLAGMKNQHGDTAGSRAKETE